MIAYLIGEVKLIQDGNVVLLVGGVGYLVRVPARLLPTISLKAQKEFYIHTQVREDAFNLYGFESKDELQTFEMLINVSGVGPKTAMILLSGESPDKIRKAIFSSDLDFFTQVPGIGKKNAQRIIVELRTKVGSDDDSVIFESNQEVSDALVAWGFDRKEIAGVLKGIDGDLSPEAQIKLALKSLNKK